MDPTAPLFKTATHGFQFYILRADLCLNRGNPPFGLLLRLPRLGNFFLRHIESLPEGVTF